MDIQSTSDKVAAISRVAYGSVIDVPSVGSGGVAEPLLNRNARTKVNERSSFVLRSVEIIE